MAVRESAPRRVGLLGGTFDPIHIGHLVLGEEAWGQLHLDRVVFIPAGLPPHKLEEPVLAAEHRAAMVRLAIEGNDSFILSEVELERPGPHYTVDTLKILGEQWGASTTIFLILGMDSLEAILSWHDPRELIRLSRLAVARRSGFAVDLDQLERDLPGIRDRLTFFDMPEVGIASTDLRRRVRESRSIRYQVPRRVEEYIRAQGLYKELDRCVQPLCD